jgi:chromosome segregation ATPase
MTEPKMSPEVFAAAADDAVRQAMPNVRAALAIAPRDRVLVEFAEKLEARYPSSKLAPMLSAALLALADEEGSHAMTASSFEIFAESAAEETRRTDRYRLAYTAARRRARRSARETAGARGQLGECYAELARHAEEISRSERYRLAWTHARDRAAAYADEIDELKEERAYLRLSLRERDEELAAVVSKFNEAYAGYVNASHSAEVITGQRDACLEANYQLLGERDTARSWVESRDREILRHLEEEDRLSRYAGALEQQCQAFMVERDEVRSEAYGTRLAYDSVVATAGRLRDRIAELLGQRDEARAELDILRQQALERDEGLNLALEEVTLRIAERDEARSALAEAGRTIRSLQQYAEEAPDGS